jgi:heterodisulfide reductase subunit B
MEAALAFEYENRVRPRSLLDIVANDFTRAELTGAVKKPLAGLKVVSYYGCLLVRPPEYTGRWDDPEHPQAMDAVCEAMGAEAVPWSYGVDCCGGSLTLNRSDVVVHLVDKLLRAAHEAGADALVTACPMCMANVDGRQKYRGGMPIPRPPKPEYEPLPIFYFTELMAMAYGLPMEKVLKKHLVDPRPLLKERGIVG